MWGCEATYRLVEVAHIGRGVFEHLLGAGETGIDSEQGQRDAQYDGEAREHEEDAPGEEEGPEEEEAGGEGALARRPTDCPARRAG